MPDTADRPPVTFFVMAYNQERHVREAIESAFAQTYEPLELLFSDDASDDSTFQIMEEMAAAYEGPHRVVLNRNPRNLGLTAHIDRIMEISSGEFVVQNAGDDISRADRTEKLVGAWLASGRRAKAVHSAFSVLDPRPDRPLLRTPQLMIDDPTPLNIVRRNLFAHGASLGWSREVFDVFGPLGPDARVEDQIIPFRAAILGTVGFVDEELVAWREGGLSRDHDDRAGLDFLYGLRLRLRRWHVGSFTQQIRDAGHLPPGSREAVIEEAQKGLEAAAFDVALADASRSGRLALLPRAIRLSLQRRNPQFLRQWLRYLLDALYIRWIDLKHRRKKPAPLG